MVAVFLSPLYVLINIYIVMRSLKWLGNCNDFFKKRWFKIVFIVVYAFFALSIIIAFFLPASEFQRIMKLISNQFLGVLIYAFLAIGIADIIGLILRKMKKVPDKNTEPEKYRKTFVITGAVVAVCAIGMSVYGAINAQDIKINNYEVTVDKECGDIKNLKVVLIADLHLGYNIGIDMMEQMVEKVNAQNPDLIMIAGDIYDNEYEALENPERLAEILSGMKSTYGTYACYGNHDIEEPILAGFTFDGNGKKITDSRLTKFVEDCGIHLLTDESVLIDDSFYVVGRRDYERPGNEAQDRLGPDKILEGLDLTKPIFVIDHEPRELQALADAGVDIDLCGHTHDGQLFPGNITINFFWENACGYLLKDDMHNIVTSGVGLFGPNMRTFTDSEICVIDVNFK